MKDGKRHGRGIYTWANGDIYNGTFIENARTGNGRMAYKNGDLYDGDWLNGLKDG